MGQCKKEVLKLKSSYMSEGKQRKSLETIYKSFILPHFDYGDILYDNCSLYITNKLEEIHLDALRTIIGGGRGGG